MELDGAGLKLGKSGSGEPTAGEITCSTLSLPLAHYKIELGRLMGWINLQNEVSCLTV